MEYMLITKDNIDKEHICCAMSNNQAATKKQWLKQRLEEGLVFYRSVERGKCFIEYIDAEKAWNPIVADNYLFINCLWVSGQFKGHGYSNDLLDYCISDAKARHKAGICVISSPKKKGFVADGKYLQHKGFRLCDQSPTGFTLLYLPLQSDALPPRFAENAKIGKIEDDGLVIYYTSQCPFTYYWVPREVEALKQVGICAKVVHITSREMAQSMPVPITNYALFIGGNYITHEIQSEKKIVALATK